MIKYVSRGGLKLECFLRSSGLKIQGMTVLDVGSSHGGFTQASLMAGAKRVYALDVGKGVLDWRLRTLPEVTVMEGFNARDLRPDDFDETPEACFVDVSFISLKKVLPAVFGAVSGHTAALVKPQFEATYEEVSRGRGIVDDTAIHQRVLDEIREAVKNENWEYIGTYPCTVKGRKGNREYFIYYRRVSEK